MDLAKCTLQLNNLLFGPLSVGENIKSVGARFYSGEVEKIVGEIIRENTPSAKVAVFAFSDTFNAKGLKILEGIRNSGGFPINVVLERDTKTSVDTVAGFMNIAEDVRIAIVLDGELNSLVSYFASLRNIPLISVLYEFKPKGLLAKRVLIKNGEDIETFGISAFRHIVFSNDILKDKVEVANAYAYAASKIVALTDYRISQAIAHESVNKMAYYMARGAVLGVLSTAVNDADYNEKLFVNCMKLEIADSMTGGRLISFSSAAVASFLAVGSYYGEPRYELAAACVILELYDCCFSKSEKSTDLPPDYIERVEKLVKSRCFSESVVLKNLKAQIAEFNFKRKRISTVKETLKSEIEKCAKLTNKMMQRYYELGGVSNGDTTSLADAVMLSGDTPISVNGMSLVREAGVLNK